MGELDAAARFVRDYDWLAVLIIVIAAWLLGLVHSDREFKAQALACEKQLTEQGKRFDDMKSDRDEWRDKAGVAIRALEQLTDVMQPAQNPKRGR